MNHGQRAPTLNLTTLSILLAHATNVLQGVLIETLFLQEKILSTQKRYTEIIEGIYFFVFLLLRIYTVDVLISVS